MEPDDWDEPRVRFSGVEMLHLLASAAVLTVGFSFALGGLDGAKTSFCSLTTFDCSFTGIRWDRVIAILPYSALIVLTSFLLHELAHKVSAQFRAMWAEFRASASGLLVALGAAAGTGVVLAAPGAVVIYGDADERDSGIISIVGPLVNLVLGYAALPFALAREKLLPLYKGGPDLFFVVVFVNAFLAAFNMLPIHPLDGSKVWAWSRIGYLLVVAFVLALFGFLLFGTSPLPACVGQAC